MNWSWWKARAFETGAALLIASGIVSLSGQVSDRQRDLLPASAWFVVDEVYVPDHARGSNPEIIYDRTIRENFTAFWIVEVQGKTIDGLWTTVCSGDGVNEYDPADVIPDNTVSWEWFIGRPCTVPMGTYRLKATYVMTRSGWPEKRTFVVSKEFDVTRPTAR